MKKSLTLKEPLVVTCAGNLTSRRVFTFALGTTSATLGSTGWLDSIRKVPPMIPVAESASTPPTPAVVKNSAVCVRGKTVLLGGKGVPLTPVKVGPLGVARTAAAGALP